MQNLGRLEVFSIYKYNNYLDLLVDVTGLLPGKVACVRNDVPGECHRHVLVSQQTVTVVPEIIPKKIK